MDEQTAPVTREDAADAGLPWSAGRAFWTAWLMPATTARRTMRLPLGRAWCVHVVASLLAVVLFTFFVSWDERRSLSRIFDGMLSEFGGLIEQFVRYPMATTLAVAAAIVGVELGFLLLAGMLMAWGARDERVRSSYAHALRRTWLHTAHVLPAIALVGVVVVHFDRWQWEWYVVHGFPNVQISFPDPPPAPVPPAVGISRASPEWKAYRAANRQYYKQLERRGEEYRWRYQAAISAQVRAQPWRVRYRDLFVIPTICLAAAWVAWALLRAIGTREGVRLMQRPPMCEACGYNLSVTPMDSRCPECGRPVVESLGPRVRPGTPWERRREVGRLRAWWRCCVDVTRRPRQFGQQVRISPADHSWQSLLILHLGGVFLVGTAAGILIPVVAKGPAELVFDTASFLTFAASVGSCMGLFALLWTTAAAGIVGFVDRLRFGRNLLPAVIQNSVCLSIWLALGGLALTALGIAIFLIRREHILDQWLPTSWLLAALMDSLAALGLTTAVLLLHLFLLFRATSGARYANR